jgi:VanZ family protein
MIPDHARSKIVVTARVLLTIGMLFTLYEATIRHPIPGPNMENGDKLMHATAFFVLTILMDMSFPPVRLLLQKVLSLMAFGILIECWQAYLPWRSADIGDFLADCLGIVSYLFPAVLSRLVAFLHNE